MSNVVQMRRSTSPDSAELIAELAGYEDMPLFMSPAQLAEVIGTTPTSLARWRKEKPLRGPAFSALPGTQMIRYARPDVLAWIEACKVAAP